MFDFEPTPAEVHAQMPQRVEGGFDDDTVPTKAEVVTIITNIASEVAAEVGTAIPDEELVDKGGVNPLEYARFTVGLGVVAEIERAFFPEQHDESDESTYARYYARYKDALERLRKMLHGGTSHRVGTIRLRSATNP